MYRYLVAGTAQHKLMTVHRWYRNVLYVYSSRFCFVACLAYSQSSRADIACRRSSPRSKGKSKSKWSKRTTYARTKESVPVYLCDTVLLQRVSCGTVASKTSSLPTITL